jgi:mannose-6-phosphate isomerase
MAGRLLLLDNPVQHYAWGSRTAIPGIVGADNPRDEPWAELWIGAHPAAPSTARVRGELRPLPALLDARVLGTGVAARGGGELPFLLKLLAAAEPLSIQCHPDRAQAQAGFEREEFAGIPLEAPQRCYRDRNHKPELLVAESPFFALAGFRRPEDIAAHLEALSIDELQPEIAALGASGALKPLFAALMNLDLDRKARVLAQAARGARAGASPEARRVAELLARYPGDIGALAPALLNLLELAPGEGLYLPARQLHAYLEGVGVEVMASSDNVLRGGLTSKHVDVYELLSVLDFEPRAPSIIRPELRGGGWVYPTPAEEFELMRLDVDDSSSRELLPRGSVAIAFCIEGDIDLLDSTTGQSLALRGGRAALISAEVERLHLEGRGRLYVARPGSHGDTHRTSKRPK